MRTSGVAARRSSPLPPPGSLLVRKMKRDADAALPSSFGAVCPPNFVATKLSKFVKRLCEEDRKVLDRRAEMTINNEARRDAAAFTALFSCLYRLM